MNPICTLCLVTPLTFIDELICDIGGVNVMSPPRRSRVAASILTARVAASYASWLASMLSAIWFFSAPAALLMTPAATFPRSPSPKSCLRRSSLMMEFLSASRFAIALFSFALATALNGLILLRKPSSSPPSDAIARGRATARRGADVDGRRRRYPNPDVLFDDDDDESDADVANAERFDAIARARAAPWSAETDDAIARGFPTSDARAEARTARRGGRDARVSDCDPRPARGDRRQRARRPPSLELPVKMIASSNSYVFEPPPAPGDPAHNSARHRVTIDRASHVDDAARTRERSDRARPRGSRPRDASEQIASAGRRQNSFTHSRVTHRPDGRGR